MTARCDAEMCQHWTGHGCACEVLGIERPERVCMNCASPISDGERWDWAQVGPVHYGCPEDPDEDEVEEQWFR